MSDDGDMLGANFAGLDDEDIELLLPLNCFDHYHPFGGKPPELFPDQFDRVASRARKLLDGWRAEDVLLAADYLTVLLIADAQPSSLGPGLAAEAAIDWTRSTSLELELPPTNNGREASWSHCFAAYALAYIGFACEACALDPRTESPLADDGVRERYALFGTYKGAFPIQRESTLTRTTIAAVGRDLAVAVEAVAVAEALLPIQSQIASARSRQARNAIAVRQARYRELRRRVEAVDLSENDFLDATGNLLSTTKLAHIIWHHRLSDADRAVLTGKDPEATVARWIRDRQKKESLT
jgi:hypothetical protein